MVIREFHQIRAVGPVVGARSARLLRFTPMTSPIEPLAARPDPERLSYMVRREAREAVDAARNPLRFSAILALVTGVPLAFQSVEAGSTRAAVVASLLLGVLLACLLGSFALDRLRRVHLVLLGLCLASWSGAVFIGGVREIPGLVWVFAAWVPGFALRWVLTTDRALRTSRGDRADLRAQHRFLSYNLDRLEDARAQLWARALTLALLVVIALFGGLEAAADRPGWLTPLIPIVFAAVAARTFQAVLHFSTVERSSLRQLAHWNGAALTLLAWALLGGSILDNLAVYAAAAALWHHWWDEVDGAFQGLERMADLANETAEGSSA